MRGGGYWSAGITVRADPGGGGWGAEARFCDDGFGAGDDADKGAIATEGTLGTRYVVSDGDKVDALTAVIDVVKADAERLGITWRDPAVYMDDEAEERSLLPAGWRETVNAQAKRLGWRPGYESGQMR